MRTVITRIAVVGAVIAIAAACTAFDDKADDAGAFTICQQFVEDRLAYPGSSEFQSIVDAIIEVDENDAVVTSYVDAANGFGALSRRPFVCEVHYLGDDEWRLDSLDIDLES